jgi:hypothetical protein
MAAFDAGASASRCFCIVRLSCSRNCSQGFFFLSFIFCDGGVVHVGRRAATA